MSMIKQSHNANIGPNGNDKKLPNISLIESITGVNFNTSNEDHDLKPPVDVDLLTDWFNTNAFLLQGKNMLKTTKQMPFIRNKTNRYRSLNEMKRNELRATCKS